MPFAKIPLHRSPPLVTPLKQNRLLYSIYIELIANFEQCSRNALPCIGFLKMRSKVAMNSMEIFLTRLCSHQETSLSHFLETSRFFNGFACLPPRRNSRFSDPLLVRLLPDNKNASRLCSHQESNLNFSLRRGMSYPLNDESRLTNLAQTKGENEFAFISIYAATILIAFKAPILLRPPQQTNQALPPLQYLCF